MENTYHFELTRQQKRAAFTYLIVHSLFFVNIAVDFMYMHF
ncbi:hypothetical protein [Macrococcoides canis]|nr:hypothetical protein [Macrococcus canis]